MKLLLVLLPFCALASEPVAHLEHLIAVTKKTLESEMQLKEELLNYEATRAHYEEQSENKDLLFEVAKRAKSVRQKIEAHHFTYLFPSEYLEELKHYSELA